MSIKHGIVVAFTIAVGTGEIVLGGSLQKPPAAKPTEEIAMFIMNVAPPATFAELLNTVDLIAHVDILSSEPRKKQIPGGIERSTLYVAEVKEPGRHRRFTRSGDKIRIVQMGGVFEEPDKIVRQIDKRNPPLAAGRSYVLALDWADDRDAYMVAYSSDGVMEIQGGKVFPRGTSPAIREFRGKGLREAIQRIK